MLDAVRLSERSVAFAMTSWRDRLYLAWTGTDLHLNVAWSPDGREIMGKRRLAHQSYSTDAEGRADAFAPSLAGAGEHLYLAWTGFSPETGDRHIKILTEPESPHGAPVRLEEARTESDPVLCSHQGSLVLAWMGTDGHINIRTSPESPHGAPVRLEEAISCPWALCSHQGRLVLAWAERLARLKSRFFGVRHINIRTSLESPHGAPVRLEEARVPLGTGPALCSHQGSLVLAWTDTDHRIKILADPQSPYGVPVRLEDARTQAWPALCSHQGSLILAWSGNDRHLNLARLK